jgi:PleD family two-component response regulator
MIPVIVLSNLGEDENIKRAIQLGAADYFVKTQHPINEIIEKVKTQAEKGR